MKFQYFLIPILFFFQTSAYKILVYSPKFGTSHVNFNGKLADILVRAGHDVKIYAPTIDDSITTNGTKLAKVLLRSRDFELMNNEEGQKSFWDDDVDGLSMMNKNFGNLCQKQIRDSKIMDQLKNENFDIALGEIFDFCYYGILKRIGLKNYITLSSSGVVGYGTAFGIPGWPGISFIPYSVLSLKPPFLFIERIINFSNMYTCNINSNRNWGGHAIDFLQEYFGNFDVDEHLSKSAYYFANVDEHIDFPRPISHKIIYIGGIGKVMSKPLDKKFEEIMQNSKRGVILVSFGTVAMSSEMPNQLKQIFLKTFSNFPDVTFLWKYEKDEHHISAGYKNVITKKWVPQNDLLEHSKLIGFVSHGGMNSVQEAASKGVPTVMLPIFGDQFGNARMLEYRNMAVVLDFSDITVEKLTAALKKIIEDDSYRKNAKKIANMMSTKPLPAEERVVKFTEFAAKFGPDLNLDMHGASLTFIEFYCLDIIIPAILFGFIVLYFVYRTVRFILAGIQISKNRQLQTRLSRQR